MRFKPLFSALLGLSAVSRFNAQSVQCVTLADGCDAGANNEAALSSAISKFQNGMLYGGSDPIVFSSALQGSVLGIVSYTCNDGSIPPRLEGSVIRSNFQKILSCANRCGGVASPSNSNCGFGAMIANNGANIGCFSKAVNVAPQGTAQGTTTTTTTSKTSTTTTVTTSKITTTAVSTTTTKITTTTVATTTTISTTKATTTTSTTTTAPAQPTANPVSDPWKLVGCQIDSSSNRALENSKTSSDMTVDKCLELADTYKYAAVQNGNTCYWGDDLGSSSQDAGSGECKTPCAGKTSEICGGTLRNLLYEDTSFELIDIDGMIDLLNDLDINEKDLQSTLDLWERTLALAKADSDASEKRWLILAFWVARLVPIWNRMRPIATALNTLTRSVQRKAAVWARKTKQQAVQEYRMIEYNRVEQHVAAAENAAGQVVRYEAEQAVEAAAGGGLAIIGAAELGEIIGNFIDALKWHRDLQKYYPPEAPADPNEPPDDPPPSDPDIYACPCGSNGCPAPSAILKRASRSANSLNELRVLPTILVIVQDLASERSHIRTTANSSKFMRHSPGDPQFPTNQCFWKLVRFDPPGAYDPDPPYVSGYSSEHTFENQFLQKFFQDMVNNGCVPCEDQTPPQQPGQPAPSIPVKDYLVDKLHWYHARNNRNRWQFTILENRINTAKNNLFTSNNMPVDPAGDKEEFMDHFMRRLGRGAAVIEYMNQPDVAAAFMAAFNRLLAEFQAFDNDVYGIQFPPLNVQTCTQNIPGVRWSNLFFTWISNVLRNGETKMLIWRDRAVASINRKNRDEYDATNFPALHTIFDNWLQNAYPVVPAGWPTGPLALMYDNAFRLNPALYPGLV
ncbi:hypothetical protein H072_311 [Dactylellina haptotyla CBS 200.50]|uniref:WSC domain-containing protein n=1 Tax=Dactylellina haptotyla (strain CBS 200.50) TaxID=1284197 RepID=S8AXI6_DACHA|nr:hypothetical protein H072_311 [Dactylellina haptotyla CBS 200.50]